MQGWVLRSCGDEGSGGEARTSHSQRTQASPSTVHVCSKQAGELKSVRGFGVG